MNTSMEKSNKAVIIADTSGLISLFSPNDQNHAVALEAAKRLSNEREDILIPAAVLVEFLNILGRKAGHSAALAVVAELTPPFLVRSGGVRSLYVSIDEAGDQVTVKVVNIPALKWPGSLQSR